MHSVGCSIFLVEYFFEVFKFRMIGGTAVALHFDHRISVDIDLFTGEKVNKIQTAASLMEKFPGSEA